MWSSQNKKIAGFTLIETVIVLAITIMILLIPVLTVNNLDNQVKRTQVINSFKSNFNQATKYAVLEENAVLINYDRKNHLITFSCADKFMRELETPNDFEVYGFNKSIYIAQTGTVTPRTITFKQGKWTKNIKIQMKWGQLIETD